MKLISWNVNGLRAVHRKGCWGNFVHLGADIFCLQEIKAEPEQLPLEVKHIEGYHAYFNPSRLKKGYSGVAVYTKREPERVEYGMGIAGFDEEGRILTLYFKDMVLCNVYFPNGGMGPERLQFKMDFYDAFLEYINRVRDESGLPVVFCGDVNTAHEDIDLARPKENETNTGFLPEERAWLDEVLRNGYSDTFRTLHPNETEKYTYWDLKTRARERNVGWRLDYFFVSADLMPHVKHTDILSGVYGSDHCPISMELR